MVKEEMFMDEITLEKAFSEALGIVSELHGWGFQAKVCKITGVDSSNLNSIIRRGKGTKESTRREIFEAVKKLVPQASEWSYDGFLEMGFRTEKRRVGKEGIPR